MKLFLVRHGQSLANAEHYFAGQGDAPLTELGRQQAMGIRDVLKDISFDRVYSSDLSRAIDTQKLALPGAEDVIRTPLIREIHVGELENSSIEEANRRAQEMGIVLRRDGYAAFGGESVSMMQDRVQEFLHMLEEDPCDCVAAFAHNGVLGITLQIVLGVEFDRAAVFSQNCAIHVFEFANGKWRLLAWNYKADV
jgi:broad specificity phosphatase PhoE